MQRLQHSYSKSQKSHRTVQQCHSGNPNPKTKLEDLGWKDEYEMFCTPGRSLQVEDCVCTGQLPGLNVWTCRKQCVKQDVPQSQLIIWAMWDLQYFVVFAFDSPGGRLKSIEEEVLKQLVEQMKWHSESLISQMKKATFELKTEPLHFRDFAKYASMVKNLFTLMYLHV